MKLENLSHQQMDSINELQVILDDLHRIPEYFGVQNRRDYDYQRGKIKFDSWLKIFTNWMYINVPGSDTEIRKLLNHYSDTNCRPVGSGYGTKKQMVNTVFIKPLVNRIELFQEEIASGQFEILHKTEATNSVIKSKEAVIPAKHEIITLSWLANHVPLKLWFIAGSILVSVFLAGVYIGQTDMYKAIYHVVADDEKK